MMQLYFIKWKEPQIHSSFVIDPMSNNEFRVSGRVQNSPITNRFKNLMVGHRNEVKRLAISIAITQEELIGEDRKLLRPIIWDQGTRRIAYSDSLDIAYEHIMLPESARIAGETKILIKTSQDIVKAYRENGDTIILNQGNYELHMQIIADGRIIDVRQRFTVLDKLPFIEWISEKCQSEK
ncbi:MAG: hypothetical protein ABSB31_06705 [Dehalococcoidia bacterium]